MRYAALGQLPPKRHAQFRDDGRLLVEEVMGYEGFSGNESILYHLNSPCRIAEVRKLAPIQREEWTPEAHVHRLTDLQAVEPGGDPLSGRRVLMFNGDLEVSVCKPTDQLAGFYRNGQGDEVSPRLNFKLTYQPSANDTVTGHLQYDSYNIIGRAGVSAAPGRPVERDPERQDRNGCDHAQPERVALEPLRNLVAEPAGADQSSNHDDGEHHDDPLVHAEHDRVARQRDLHLQQHLPPRGAERTGRLDRLGRDATQAARDEPDHDGHRVQHRGDDPRHL